MRDGNHDLEPIDPSTAQQLYLDHKDSHCAEQTLQSHRYRTNHFVRWCDENGIDNMNDLTGRDIHQYRLWRAEDGNLNKISILTQMSTIRVFLKWCGSVEAVDPNLHTKVLIPQVSSDEERSDVMLESDRAEEILAYLSKYHYASLKHVLLALLWQTGMRIGAARTLDLKDIDLEEKFLEVSHRPETGTPLKNRSGGERLVAISSELMELLNDHIDDRRGEGTDEYDRRPLLLTEEGRMSTSTMRRIVYEVTAPCFRGEKCPNCKPTTSEKCGQSVSPHAIRRGSITHHLTSDVPVEIVGDRMDVSRGIIDKHYDQRSEKVKLDQRRGYLDNI